MYNKTKRKLFRNNNSVQVTINKKWLESLGVGPGDHVWQEIKHDRNGYYIVMHPAEDEDDDETEK